MKTKHTFKSTISLKGWILYLGLAYLLLPKDISLVAALLFSFGLIIILDLLGLTRF